MHFKPPYPKPHTTKTSFLLRFFRGWHSWLDVLFEKSYSMKMGKVWQPGLDVFMINDPKWVKTILVDEPKAYPKHRLLHEMLEPLLGNSIFTTNGEVWQRQRRLMDAGFGQARLKLVFPLMSSAINDMLERLDRHADGTAHEIDPEMTHITADIIFRTILSESLSDVRAKSIFEAFNDFQLHAQRALMLSVYNLPTYFAKRASKKAADRIRPVLAEVVSRRYAALQQQTGPVYNDILAGIMQPKAPATEDRFSVDEMVDQICMLFLAGHETSASALTWSFYLISQCPHMQDRMLEEINATAGEREFCFEDVKQLHLVNNVFLEALRLYPPVGFFSREATHAHCIRDKEIRPGAALLVSPWLLQRNKNHWPEPHAFDPDRFDTEAGKAAAKCAYIPFSKGPRVCIGQSFAMQEAILIIAGIVRKYRINAVENHVPRAVGRVTIRPENGVKIRLVKR